MDGIIPLYKERGMTSFDCVSRLRRILKTRKIGHSGTLDPSVDGVLPICVGTATKAVEYLMQSGKVYQGELVIGRATETEDFDGQVIEQAPVKAAISDEAVTAAMTKLTGEITQVPPMYSAVKVNGKRLYEYARAGETVDRPTRHVTITDFTLIRNHYDQAQQEQHVFFKVACSKGTYVRTLVVDLARQLGYPGAMKWLTRLESGGFTIDQTLSLADVQDAVASQTMKRYLYPLDYALKDYPVVELTEKQWRAVQNGGWLTNAELSLTAEEVVLKYDHQVKALYYRDTDHYKPTKMFSVN
ncbi:MAG TPA: tRNA pseudouridine(55) synthase TruB [Limosilactobacillus oris]|uniref:tRNA pseudouridine(55) synthase TruB n=1 Tax=Limosilactobacillus oris TaxID=1632 RepID=UPI001E064579|nr:tRNA pseudouridine(55) synthase TruB [Limosilactobacillus oris]HJF46962.1 tRNA pseudouridine(55) synthase TruB [Limosilactobacillus oris]